MANTTLLVPTNNQTIEVFDVSTASAPVLGTAFSLPANVGSVQALAQDSSGNIFVADKVNGRVVKLNSSGTVLVNEVHLQSGEGPQSIVVDEDDAVWIFFGNSTDTLKLFNATLLVDATVSTVTGDLVAVGANETYNAVIAYDRADGITYRISNSSDSLAATYDLVTLITDSAFADQVTQPASASDKVFTVIQDTVSTNYKLVLIDLDTDTVATGDSLGTDKPTALFTDGTNVYVADLQNNIWKFSFTGGLLGMFHVDDALGTISALSTTNDLDSLLAVDDGFFTGKMRVHSIDTDTGTTSSTTELLDSSVGRTLGSDLTGYQRLDNIQTVVVPTPAPTFDSAKIFVLVHEDGLVNFVGLPGAASGATTIDFELPPTVDVVTGLSVNPDGSFAGATAAGVGSPAGLEACVIEFTGPGGATDFTTTTLSTAWRFDEQQVFELDAAAKLQELVNRSADILGVPITQLTDFDTYGGFTVRRLQDIHRGVRCLVSRISKFEDIRVQAIDVLAENTFVNQGDTPEIEFTVIDPQTSLAVDIEGATVTFQVFDALEGTTLIFQKSCEIISATDGLCSAVLTASDTAASGEFAGVLRVVFPGGVLLATPRFTFTITPTP